MIVALRIFLVQEAAAQLRADAQNPENARGDQRAIEQFGLAHARQIWRGGFHYGNRFQGRPARAPLVIMAEIDGQTRVQVRKFGDYLADRVQPLRIAVGQRAQQHAVDHRKDGGIGADAHGQAQHGHGREAPLAQQGAESVANVVPHEFAGDASHPRRS